LHGLASSDLRVVATTQQDIAGSVPERLVIGRGSHTALVQQAAVFVCPGGHGTIVKALAAGCPVVIAPIQGDQRETARRVSLAGAGVTVRWGPLFSARLAAAVQRVMRDHRYRDAAQGLGRGGSGLGPGRAARLIEAVVTER